MLINQVDGSSSVALAIGAATGAEAGPTETTVVAGDILERAQGRAARDGLAYAGSVTPEEAWTLHSQGAAQIVDIRTAEELHLVGRLPDVVHVAWATGLSMTRNPRFLRELESKAGKAGPLLLLCRSGKRSHAAAEAATKAGFRWVLNILEGFEGDLDERQQRGRTGGWRLRGLPWVQD